MRVEMADFANDGVLAGSDTGRLIQSKLLVLAGKEPDAPELVFLDFGDVDVATASFLREAVFAFRDAVRGRKSYFYPVIANAGELVKDELQVLVRSLGQAIAACSLSKRGQVSGIGLIGELEPKQRLTFDLIEERQETDAAALMREQNEAIGQTAWNNRLSTLADLGLVIELSQGRSKRYRRLFLES